MAEEEVIDAEAGTLNKQVSPVEHLRHLVNIGWKPTDPVIQTFIDKHGLSEELDEIWVEYQQRIS